MQGLHIDIPHRDYSLLQLGFVDFLIADAVSIYRSGTMHYHCGRTDTWDRTPLLYELVDLLLCNVVSISQWQTMPCRLGYVNTWDRTLSLLDVVDLLRPDNVSILMLANNALPSWLY